MNEPFGERQRNFQKYRRGRYAEFNFTIGERILDYSLEEERINFNVHATWKSPGFMTGNQILVHPRKSYIVLT